MRPVASFIILAFLGGVATAEPLEAVTATGIAELSASLQCPELTAEAVDAAKEVSVDKARELCASPEVYPLRSWEVTTTCEETTCCFGETTYTLRVFAFTEFLCR